MLAHQIYDATRAAGPYRLIQPRPADLAEAGPDLTLPLERLRDAGFSDIVLLHGTFVGQDPLGILRRVGRVWPDAGRLLQHWQKRTADRMFHDAGNFDDSHVQRFAAAGLQTTVCSWSGENHHAGRADGAIRLLHQLHAARPQGRVLLIAHSHGGNVLALATALLAADDLTRQSFFTAAARIYQTVWRRRVDGPRWPEVQAALSDFPVRLDQLWIATLGTPVRYGWPDLGGRLLHFVHHRPLAGRPEWQAEFPPRRETWESGGGGDYVQQLGVAGTNLRPGWLAFRNRNANRLLARLLQAEPLDAKTANPPARSRLKRLWRRLCCGVRVHAAGTTLLVDYAAVDEEADDVLGHAVYTRHRWLPFHLEQIVREVSAFGAAATDRSARVEGPGEGRDRL